MFHSWSLFFVSARNLLLCFSPFIFVPSPFFDTGSKLLIHFLGGRSPSGFDSLNRERPLCRRWYTVVAGRTKLYPELLHYRSGPVRMELTVSCRNGDTRWGHVNLLLVQPGLCHDNQGQQWGSRIDHIKCCSARVEQCHFVEYCSSAC